jgi:PhnB protein
MAKSAKAIPEGHHTVTPYLVLRGADRAIEFYKKAFGAKELGSMPGPEGKIMHAEIRIGDSVVMLSDEMSPASAATPPAGAAPPIRIMLYLENVDAVFQQALAAGAKAVMPPQDMFWGDRYGKVIDPFGHHWDLATHKEDLTGEEIAKRQAEFFAKMPRKH